MVLSSVLLQTGLTAWADMGVWLPSGAAFLVAIAATWLLVRGWFKRKIAALEEKYLSALAKYERTKETYNSLAYNNAALRSDRNRWEEERDEIVAERQGIFDRITFLENTLAETIAAKEQLLQESNQPAPKPTAYPSFSGEASFPDSTGEPPAPDLPKRKTVKKSRTE